MHMELANHLAHYHNLLVLIERDNTHPYTLYHTFKDFLGYYKSLLLEMKCSNLPDTFILKNTFSPSAKLSRIDFYKTKLNVSFFAGVRLLSYMSEENANDYKFTLHEFAWDILPVVKFFEEEKKGFKFSHSGGSFRVSSAEQVFRAANTLFRIDIMYNKNIYLRDIYPASTFLLRQSIELLGKNILGIHQITSKNGSVQPINSKVVWEFIQKSTNNNDYKIELPIDAEIVLKIQKWANHYVHTGTLPDIFVVDFAINKLWPLFTQHKNKDGEWVYPVKVYNYEKLKICFSEYINEKGNLSLLQKFKNIVKMLKKNSIDYYVTWKSVWNVEVLK